ncbi:DUF2993 domain-containing protein [Solwaraspora sp. WMMB335]|uniref:LmeA family phospholipid-binding protein n=1 Tax=Solwaraspora sp. WMMB335 TaxID=3404118 RepID=UPI003B944AFA
MRIWRPRGRRGWLLVVAAVLAAGLPVIADRVAAGVVGDRLADAVACVAGLAEPPEVDVHGFPFVTQAVTGRFAGLTVTADRLGQGALPIAGITAEVRDVEIDGDLPAVGTDPPSGDSPVEIRIGRLHAAFTIEFAQLDTLAADRSADSGESPLAAADLRIRGGDSGQLIVDVTASLFGQAVPVTVYAVPVLDGRTLRIEPVEIEVLGLRRSADQLPGGLGDRQLERELPELPAGLAYHALTTTAEGLRLEVTGESVTVGGADLRPAGQATDRDIEPCT